MIFPIVVVWTINSTKGAKNYPNSIYVGGNLHNSALYRNFVPAFRKSPLFYAYASGVKKGESRKGKEISYLL